MSLFSATRTNFKQCLTGGGPQRGATLKVRKGAFDALNNRIRKILVSVKCLSAILGPEMAAPILWTPGKNASVLQEKPCP